MSLLICAKINRIEIDECIKQNNYIKRKFIRKFHSWTPSDAPIHPHPYFSKLYQKVAIVDNYFDIGFVFKPGTT